jgi:transcription elongation factor GreA
MVNNVIADQEKVPITQEGLRGIKEEYQKLLDEKRPRLVQRLAESRKPGDLTEDNEYTQAKQELAFVDGKISELEDVLARSVIIDEGHAGCQEVKLGCRVTLKTSKQEEVFHLVGEWEADPIGKKISHQSPLGKALLGRKVGDEIQIDAPAGKVAYKITQID